MSENPLLSELSETRQSLLSILKSEGSATIGSLATALGVSYEAVRQQIGQMRREGWIERLARSPSTQGAGRPNSSYRLTAQGEHLFPKHYDEVSVELIDAVVEQWGEEGLKKLLGQLCDRRVERWAPRLEGLPIEEKLHALKGVYLEHDPYMSVESGANGLRLIEHNCPFYNVAQRRPTLCSLTVATLTRLLGCKVVREERFQEGHGRCAFRILVEQPISSPPDTFELEDA